MSESDTTMREQDRAVIDRPGHRLAEARKARGVSLDEMAAQLRLGVAILEALENDDYSHLPPAAYVSGYLRSYARALGLSEKELTQGGAAAASEPPLVGVVARSRTGQVQASDPQVRLVSYIVIGGLLLLSSAWWLSQETPSPTLVEATAPAPEPAAAQAEGAVVAADGTAVAAAQDGSALPPGPAAPAALAAAGTAAPAPVVTPAAPPEPAPAPVAEVPPRPVAPPPPPLTAETPQSKVVLEFTADCWVDVVDAAGRQLAYDLAPAGRQMTLRGEAPFKVFFGYSPGVQVHFNDQLFDHRPLQRRDMARFKLGSAEDNAPLIEAQ